MLVVMIVWWIRMFKVCRAVIKRCIDSSRTKHYRSFIKALKGLDCVKSCSIEIQEHDEGQWIAIHLPDTAEDDSDDDEDYLDDNNFLYTKEACEWALENNARFVYASSAATYGDGTRAWTTKKKALKNSNL